MPVSRLRAAFASVRGRTGLIPFATAGYPTLERSHEILLGLADAGVLAIEMGIPFSDPIADGPEIQRASEVALAQGVGVDHVLELVRAVRARSEVPIVLMTYANPILRRGIEHFAENARAAGADGVLISDLPPEESPETWYALDRVGLDTIVLTAPTTEPLRFRPRRGTRPQRASRRGATAHLTPGRGGLRRLDCCSSACPQGRRRRRGRGRGLHARGRDRRPPGRHRARPWARRRTRRSVTLIVLPGSVYLRIHHRRSRSFTSALTIHPPLSRVAPQARSTAWIGRPWVGSAGGEDGILSPRFEVSAETGLDLSPSRDLGTMSPAGWVSWRSTTTVRSSSGRSANSRTAPSSAARMSRARLPAQASSTARTRSRPNISSPRRASVSPSL
ncbi:MAG: tryptophan synthase subunit alpha [Candidatus Eisenbacteria bacterium]|uniref:tryptophan synthase n=1 Tax=Eiseniibacteriota bacterium TaxID=2212470 RepID=A0A538TRB6_UNCEI|nr:MAG: tryptophan synthase subunit alpha [Candidatus Eisenbacteria bacterium]